MKNKKEPPSLQPKFLVANDLTCGGSTAVIRCIARFAKPCQIDEEQEKRISQTSQVYK